MDTRTKPLKLTDKIVLILQITGRSWGVGQMARFLEIDKSEVKTVMHRSPRIERVGVGKYRATEVEP